jgi:hypothetical protein
VSFGEKKTIKDDQLIISARKGSFNEVAMSSNLSRFTDFSSKHLIEKFDEIPHPSIAELALKILNGKIKGSNARCVAMLVALKKYVNVSLKSEL